MRNQKIRQSASDKGVKLWEIADRLNITDSNFSRKLRRELPEEEQAHILGIIAEIAAEKEVSHAENTI